MSKYDPVSRYLRELPRSTGRKSLPFSTIEKVLGERLPASARTYNAWWANDKAHVQARAWMEAGWKTRNVRLNSGTVDFVRQDENAVPNEQAKLAGC